MPDEPTSETSATSPFFTRQRVIIIAIIAALVALAIIVAVVAASRASSKASPAVSQSASPSSSATPSASASVSPNETSSPVPAPAPSATRGAPAPIDKPAEIVKDLTATLTNIEAVDGVASTPGEVSGPSIRFVATIKNSTSAAADLSGVVINVYYGSDQTPSIQLEKPGGAPLPSTVAAGASAQGTYVFTVPKNERSQVRIVVDYSVNVEPLVFEGSVPQ